MQPQNVNNGGFQTAKAALNAERRRNGKAELQSDEYNCGRLFQDGHSGVHNAEARRPQVASGLRRAPQSGAKGGFIPPFVKKAMEEPKDVQESGVSAKTLGLLGKLFEPLWPK